jgi:hypothetical protein
MDWVGKAFEYEADPSEKTTVVAFKVAHETATWMIHAERDWRKIVDTAAGRTDP